MGAQVQDAILAREDAILFRTYLKNAAADAKTIWPADFDPISAGVVVLLPLVHTADEPES
jgi:hypothetical protein